MLSNYNNQKYIEECLDSLIDQSYENIEIIIQDDGIGMSEEVLNLVNKNLYSKKSLGNNSDEVGKGGIGLKNIQERISLSFGENYGIVINSVEGEGTKIIVTLPYIA